jgi:uncharacterized membrane protein
MQNNNKIPLRKITTIGLLAGITVVLGSFGIGFIPLPTVKATIMHVPVIIGAILEGPVVGCVIGLIFGLFSIMQNMAGGSILSPMFLNPLVSVLPRMIIALTAYYSYAALKKKNNIVAIGVGAAVGSLTNTIGVLGMIYVLYAGQYAQIKGIAANMVAGTILSSAVINGIPEAIVAVIISIPVVISVKKMEEKKVH